MSVALSRFQARELLDARAEGSVSVSPDLGLSITTVSLSSDGARFPSGDAVTWEQLEEIAEAERKCFLVDNGDLKEIRIFSETTGWVRSLAPTRGAPTMLVSGIPMHRIKDIDPYEDTRLKIRAISPVHGRVLDTATGLGYTAIEAAKTASEVITIEIDPAALEIARMNPWSRDLFSNPKIRSIVGDVFDEITRFDSSEFSVVIHDPPTFQFAGELYSSAFYEQLFRVLSRRGRLFHYVGDPESGVGQRMTKGVIRRLQDAGFGKVVRRPEAFGVIASK